MRFPNVKWIAIAAVVLLAFAPMPAEPHMLNVPFFQDDGGNVVNSVPFNGGIAGFVAVKNTRDEPITMYLVYSQMDPQGQAEIQQAVTFRLAALQAVNFRPVADDPVEDRGRAVPNMLPGLGGRGSLQIIWIGGPELASAIVGRYQQFNSANEFAYVLLPDSL